ncbi:MAG: Fe-S cluster assembly protein SufD [Magnetococcus sp. XQGC-1]
MNTYQAQFAERATTLPGFALPPLRASRQESMDRFMQTGFPTQKLENWKYTAGKDLSHRSYTLPNPSCLGLDPEDLNPYLVDRRGSHRLVFVNGRLSLPLSDLHDLPRGVRVESLARVANDSPSDLEPHLRQWRSGQDQGFSELNHALWSDGAFVCFAPGTILSKPLQLLFLTTASLEPMMTLPWNLLVAGEDSQALVVESYATLGHALHFTNSYTTLVLGDRAHLRHLLLLGESPSAHHVGTVHTTQKVGSHYDSHLFAIGGKITRQELHVILGGEEAACSLDGLFLAKARQHMDFHTSVQHTHAATRSQQLYKGVLDEQARGVFNGVVHVPPGVRHTQSQQTTANLLLSDQAEIDTKPQLEINTDAVQCSHGATVGSLDPDALFYLQSRGVDMAAARRLLVQGFAAELLQRIKPASLQDWIGRSLNLGETEP